MMNLCLAPSPPREITISSTDVTHNSRQRLMNTVSWKVSSKIRILCSLIRVRIFFKHVTKKPNKLKCKKMKTN